MKKKIALALSLLFVLTMLVGCGLENDAKDTSANNDSNVESVKTGLGIITTLDKSREPEEDTDGMAQADSVVAAVTVDSNGKIVKCVIDTVQSKMEFSNEGKVVTDLATTFKTKLELGADYGMGKVSAIGKEWNEQAQALADFVVGKTVEEIKAISVDEQGVPTDADLTSSVTVKINSYVNAIEKAVANAQELGAESSDKLGLSVVTTMNKSRDAETDTDGQAQAYSTYSVITTDADGKISSCVIDASQGTVTFDATGKITADLNSQVKSKVELGADYGMGKVSAIGKEWFEQADAFSKYVIGKTQSDVQNIALEENVATDADLTSSCTMKVNTMINTIVKAIETAK
ncbi:hypothetical protein JYG23_06405 [Sedimentibacter sp. zth1]|uniref:hypothetical protein n=1 Tax=Sedimentibacter sp. zth1 TaxID=2816908 RepID=UPI001A91A9A8|nr:hypothetical protein [Sedimentibacter sp. zth1]QSX07015.1 hypothetical protein JYG23_06405 [Sedimentibacter sp. zth1]